MARQLCGDCGANYRRKGSTFCADCAESHRKFYEKESTKFAWGEVISWYEGKPILSQQEIERRDREQARINKDIDDRHWQSLALSPPRTLSPAEIEQIAGTITPIDEIRDYRLKSDTYWNDAGFSGGY